MSVEDIGTTAIPIPQAIFLKNSVLIELYQQYDLVTDKNARKPYMSKPAREFLSHLGGWGVFNQ